MKRLFPSPFEAVVFLLTVAVALVAVAMPSCTAEAGHNGVRSFSTVTTYQVQSFNGLGAGHCNQGGGQQFQSLGAYHVPAAVLAAPVTYGHSFQSFGTASHGARVNGLEAYNFQNFNRLGGHGGSVTTTTTTGQGPLGLRNRQTTRTTTRFGR